MFENENAVLGVGKNLWDGTYLDNTYLLNGQLDISTGPRTTNLIRIKPSTNYTMSGGNRTVVSYRDINNSLISFDASSVSPRTITTPSNAYYMYWYYSSDGTHENIQLEQGITATTYEPYKSTENEDLPPFISWFGQDYFGIDTLTVEQMDYWYGVYEAN